MSKMRAGIAMGLFAAAAIAAIAAADGKSAVEGVFGAEPAAVVSRVERGGDDVKRLEKLEAAVGAIEERLGRTLRKPTATRNFERRIEALEDAVERLKGDLKKLEALEREQKRQEDRIRKLENKR